MRSLPTRAASTGIGTLPLRKPGIFRDAARSVAACSTACRMSALGTSTLWRTLSAPSSSTRVSTSPFKQTAFDPPPATGGDEKTRNRHEEGTDTCVFRLYDSRRVAGGEAPH